jgi:putative transposase
VQARDQERHAGAARFAFNWALAQVKANIGQRTAERSCGVDGEDLTAALGWNLPALRRAWNAAKSNPRSPRGGVSAAKRRSALALDGVARSLKN